MSSTIAWQLGAFVFYFLYGSFFEWAFHKHLFHSPKYIKATFKAHALVHHQVYKYEPSAYEWQEGKDQDKEHITMDWFALPLFVGVHLPFLYLIEYVTKIPSMWGGIAAISTYYFIYEYFHYCMHVPNGRAFEKSGVFKYAKEHHRIHHKHMQQNLNVYFPLADKVLGTYRSVKSMTPAVATSEAVVSNERSLSDVSPLKMRKKAKTYSGE